MASQPSSYATRKESVVKRTIKAVPFYFAGSALLSYTVDKCAGSDKSIKSAADILATVVITVGAIALINWIKKPMTATGFEVVGGEKVTMFYADGTCEIVEGRPGMKIVSKL